MLNRHQRAGRGVGCSASHVSTGAGLLRGCHDLGQRGCLPSHERGYVYARLAGARALSRWCTVGVSGSVCV